MPSPNPPANDLLESPPEPAASDRPTSGRRDRGPRPPLFAGATPEPTPAADPASPADPPSPASPPDGEGSATGSRRRPKLGRRARGEHGATPSSGPTPKPAKVDKRQLKAAIGGGVGLVGHQLHTVLCRDDDERALGLWLADEQDQTGIAEPVANIAARRSGPELANPDLLDAIAALIAVVGYVSKQLAVRARLRQLRAAGLTAEPGDPAAAGGGDPAPAAGQPTGAAA